MEEVLKVHFFEKKKEYLEFEGLEDCKKSWWSGCIFTNNNSGGVSIKNTWFTIW